MQKDLVEGGGKLKGWEKFLWQGVDPTASLPELTTYFSLFHL